MRNIHDGCLSGLKYIPSLSIVSSDGAIQSLTWKLVKLENPEGFADMDMLIDGEAITRSAAQGIYVNKAYALVFAYSGGQFVSSHSWGAVEQNIDFSFQEGDSIEFTQDLSSWDFAGSPSCCLVFWTENMPGGGANVHGFDGDVTDAAEGETQYYSACFDFINEEVPTVASPVSGGGGGCNEGFASWGLICMIFPLLLLRRK